MLLQCHYNYSLRGWNRFALSRWNNLLHFYEDFRDMRPWESFSSKFQFHTVLLDRTLEGILWNVASRCSYNGRVLWWSNPKGFYRWLDSIFNQFLDTSGLSTETKCQSAVCLVGYAIIRKPAHVQDWNNWLSEVVQYKWLVAFGRTSDSSCDTGCRASFA